MRTTNSHLITINPVSDEASLETVFQIRKEVFVLEQKVPEEEEYDEFENIARHFLAFFNSTPTGTARWRFTEKGIKLERFAVLKEFRGKGVGHRIVQTVIEDIKSHANFKGQLLYLHSQVTAMPLYSKSGFQKVGEVFLECDIEHFKMVLHL